MSKGDRNLCKCLCFVDVIVCVFTKIENILLHWFNDIPLLLCLFFLAYKHVCMRVIWSEKERGQCMFCQALSVKDVCLFTMVECLNQWSASAAFNKAFSDHRENKRKVVGVMLRHLQDQSKCFFEGHWRLLIL